MPIAPAELTRLAVALVNVAQPLTSKKSYTTMTMTRAAISMRSLFPTTASLKDYYVTRSIDWLLIGKMQQRHLYVLDTKN